MRSFEARPRLLQDFLIPHLDRGTFKSYLQWVDREKGEFSIFWRHQSSSRFCLEDSCVFVAWAQMKHLLEPDHPKSATICKQRMRAALQKLKSVKLQRKDGESRIYRIVASVGFEDESPSTDESTDSSSSFTGSSLPMNSLQDNYFLDWFEDEIINREIDAFLSLNYENNYSPD